MAYSVRYGNFKYDKKSVDRKKRSLKIAAILLFAVFLAAACFPKQVGRLRSSVFPWFEKNVQEAFSDMISSVEEGETFSEAASAFCREIIFESKD